MPRAWSFVQEQLLLVATTTYSSSLSGSGLLSGSISPFHLDPDPDPDSDRAKFRLLICNNLHGPVLQRARPIQYQPGPKAQEKGEIVCTGLKARPIRTTEIGQTIGVLPQCRERDR